jgi:sulfate transport system ATP-binding protein
MQAHGFVASGANAPFVAASRLAEISEHVSGPACAYVRPHDLQIYPPTIDLPDGVLADVRRVVSRGASVRVELAGEAGLLEAELSRDAWHALRLGEGDRVTVVPRSARVFAEQ